MFVFENLIMFIFNSFKMETKFFPQSKADSTVFNVQKIEETMTFRSNL